MTIGEWDPYNRDCPSRRLLDRIGDRWTALIIEALDHQTLRFSAIAVTVEGISQKMLTQTLRSLERDGFVRRTSYPVVPPHVEYELTALGVSLHQTLHILSAWAVENMDSVARKQADYDSVSTGHRAG